MALSEQRQEMGFRSLSARSSFFDRENKCGEHFCDVTETSTRLSRIRTSESTDGGNAFLYLSYPFLF